MRSTKWVIIASGIVLFACRGDARVTGRDAWIHDTESECGGSWKPGKTVVVSSGSSVEVLAEISQKERLCLRVRWQGRVGYVDAHDAAIKPLASK